MPSIATSELVAAGAAGDQVRRRLAAGLAELDLLEPAAALLGQLVDGYSGAARAERLSWLVKLIVVHAMVGDPSAWR